MTLRKAVQERIKYLMGKESFSQYRLAKVSGVPQSTINSILNSDFDSCKLSVVYQLSQYLCGGINEFFNCELFHVNNIESKYN